MVKIKLFLTYKRIFVWYNLIILLSIIFCSLISYLLLYLAGFIYKLIYAFLDGSKGTQDICRLH